jgi:hypothetical protein
MNVFQKLFPLFHLNIVAFLSPQLAHATFYTSVTQSLKVKTQRSVLYHDLAVGWKVMRFFTLSHFTLEGVKVAGYYTRR